MNSWAFIMCQIFYLIQGIKDKCHIGSFPKEASQTSREENQTIIIQRSKCYKTGIYMMLQEDTERERNQY